VINQREIIPSPDMSGQRNALCSVIHGPAEPDPASLERISPPPGARNLADAGHNPLSPALAVDGPRLARNHSVFGKHRHREFRPANVDG
jgi:hypothetical protein